MIIKVLGPGCKNCETLEKNVLQAVHELNLDAEVQKISDLKDIMSYGIMKTPSLVIDDTVVSHGKLLKEAEITTIITDYLKKAK